MKLNAGVQKNYGSELKHGLHTAGLVFKKDLQVEFRTRYALGSVSLFSLTTVVAVSAALSSQNLHSDVKAALLWVVLLFAAMSGLARVFVREVESGTADALKLYAPAASVYAGKLAFNLALVAAVELITVPLYLIVLPPQVIHPGLLIAVLGLGGVGLSSAATFVAALIAQAKSGKSALFFIVAFPVLMPLLLVAVKSTVGAFDLVPTHHTATINGLYVLGCYSVVTTTAALLLFEYIWRD
jgi:heme exporter protein B